MRLHKSGSALYSLTVLAIWCFAGSQMRTVVAAESVRGAQQISSSDTASRIQSKITRITARATKIHESGGDISQIAKMMDQVDRLLKAGDYVEAERILDALLQSLGEEELLSDAGERIQSKIRQIAARATQIHEAGGDVRYIAELMEQVDRLLRAGDYLNAERILDSLLRNVGEPPSVARAPAAASETSVCDPEKPMTISSSVMLHDDCTIGGDLTVTGNGVLHFDFQGVNGGRVVVKGNVVVEGDATLQVDGRRDSGTVLVIDNEFSQQRSMTSRNRATIRLNNVEFRTQEFVDRGKGSVYMSYDARDASSFEAAGSKLVEKEAWLLANFHDSATLTLIDTQHIPTEAYVHDSSIVRISAGARTGVWLDAEGATGTVTLPDVNRPFSWRIGANADLNVAWSLEVDDAQPGIGIEIKPSSALRVVGNGSWAPESGELKISYFVTGSRETLNGLKSGLQNRTISNRLTLDNVQLGPIAWQIYAGEDADLSIRNSTINEIGIFGRNARVHVEHSLLQLAVLAARAPGSWLTINASEVWNQSIEASNQANVSIADSEIYGTLFHARDSGSRISISGGAFLPNPTSCGQDGMIIVANGHPACNPFSSPGRPRKLGPGRIECAGTDGCGF
jgi:hypothetical protein